MAYFEEGSAAMVELEAMVDKVGIRNVLHALAHICAAKAEHVETNWQDRGLAKEWRFAMRRVDTFASKCGIDPNI